MGITSAQIRRAAELAKKYALTAFEVGTPEEAAAMTRNDPLGRTWQVGEKYYVCPIDRTAYAAT